MQMGLKNVFFVDGDASDLSSYFTPGEVDLIYINFCDPWPSNRHAKRRLTHPDFLMRYRQVLPEGGRFSLRRIIGTFLSGPCFNSRGQATFFPKSPGICMLVASAA